MAEESSQILIILIIGMLGMFLMAIAIVLFVLIYKKRLAVQQLDLERQKTEHQQQLLQLSIKIQDEERKRFAADLHDEIGGGISTILLYASGLESSKLDRNHVSMQTQQIRTQLNELLQRVREISYNIMPPVLETYGLMEALSDLCFQVKESKQIDVEFNWEGDHQRMSFSEEMTIYRIAKEMISNILKHAKASQLSLVVHNSPNQFQMRISDNGIGFDLDEHHQGAGMQNMQQRARIIQAKLEFHTKPTQGCSGILTLKK